MISRTLRSGTFVSPRGRPRAVRDESLARMFDRNPHTCTAYCAYPDDFASDVLHCVRCSSRCTNNTSVWLHSVHLKGLPMAMTGLSSGTKSLLSFKCNTKCSIICSSEVNDFSHTPHLGPLPSPSVFDCGCTAVAVD